MSAKPPRHRPLRLEDCVIWFYYILFIYLFIYLWFRSKNKTMFGQFRGCTFMYLWVIMWRKHIVHGKLIKEWDGMMHGALAFFFWSSWLLEVEAGFLWKCNATVKPMLFFHSCQHEITKRLFLWCKEIIDTLEHLDYVLWYCIDSQKHIIFKMFFFII